MTISGPFKGQSVGSGGPTATISSGGGFVYIKSDTVSPPTDAEFTTLGVTNIVDGLVVVNTFIATAPTFWTRSGGNWILTNTRQAGASYVIWDDGTNYHGDSMIGGTSATPGTDFGAVFNACVTGLPSAAGAEPKLGQGGSILIRKTNRAYQYSTTPLVNVSYVDVVGEHPRGVVLQPSAAVDGLTLRAPASDSLIGCSVRNIGFIDPNANGNGKVYLKLDNTTNGGGIGWGMFEDLHYYGNAGGASNTGKFIQINGDTTSHATFDCVFQRIFGGSNFMAGLNGTHVLNGTDSILDIPSGQVFDSIFRDWFFAWHNYTGTNPWFNCNASSAAATGNEWYNIKLLADTSPSSTICWKLNNFASNYIEDFFIEIGAKPASGSIGLQIGGNCNETNIRRLRILLTNIGISWTATATTGAQAGSENLIYQPMVSLTDTALQSVAGDAAYKIFYGGVVSGTTTLSPASFTNAAFFKTKIYSGSGGQSLVANQGFTVTTPSVPATGTPQTNTTGADCMVYVVPGASTCAVSVDGTATGVTLASSGVGQGFPVLAGATITLTYTSAPTWKWYGT